MAENAGNATDKASWLRLAASWLSMIKNNSSRIFGREPDAEDGVLRNRLAAAGRIRPHKDSKASH